VDIAGATRFEAFSVRPPTTAEAFTIPADECCYFAYPDPANPRGAMSPLQAVGGAVDADEAMAVSQTAMFRRGIHPSHAILVGKQPVEGIPGGLRPQLTAAQQRQIISAVLKRYSGVERHGEPIILDGMIEDIRRLSNTPAEMDWLNSGKVTKDRIFQGFGTNPIIAGQIEGANRASATAADKHFADWTVNPKIELMSQTMTEWLSPMFGGGLTIWIEPCVANDADISLQWTTLLAQNGVLTAHELRTLAPLGLKVEKAFDGRLVGGENMTTSNPIMNGIRGILKAELGNLGAEQIMAQLGVGP
jgi:phage portal protein BeeE